MKKSVFRLFAPAFLAGTLASAQAVAAPETEDTFVQEAHAKVISDPVCMADNRWMRTAILVHPSLTDLDRIAPTAEKQAAIIESLKNLLTDGWRTATAGKSSGQLNPAVGGGIENNAVLQAAVKDMMDPVVERLGVIEREEGISMQISNMAVSIPQATPVPGCGAPAPAFESL